MPITWILGRMPECTSTRLCRTSTGMNATDVWRKQKKSTRHSVVDGKPKTGRTAKNMQKQRRCCRIGIAVAVGLMILFNSTGRAQQPAAPPITIRQAVESALRNYPAVSVSQEQVNA